MPVSLDGWVWDVATDAIAWTPEAAQLLGVLPDSGLEGLLSIVRPDERAVVREAFEAAILPRVTAFAPDLIVISAGFDAHFRDPLGNLQLTEADFAWATRALMKIASRCCGDRVVSLLEGGYDLQGLARSAAAHVHALMGN